MKTFNFNGGTVSTSEAEAQAVEKAIRLYRIALDKIAHVPVTSGIGFSNYTMPDGTTILIQVEPYMGRTCSRGLSEFRTKLALDLVEAICRQVILPCFLNATDLDDMKMVTIGLDLNLRNITYKGGDEPFEVAVVDFFPWKLKKENGDYGLEYPEPSDFEVRKLGIWRHYNKAGLVINFFISLCLVCPALAQSFYSQIEKFLRTNGLDDVEAEIDQFTNGLTLDIGKEDKNFIEEVTANWSGFSDVFRYRLLAVAAALHRPKSRPILIEIQANSHFQDNRLQAGQIKAMRNLALSMFTCPVVN